MPACDDIRAINWTKLALYPDIGRIGGRNAVIGTTTKVCLAVGLLFLLELSAPDINIRLRIIGLIVLAGMLVLTAQFAIDNFRHRR